MSNYKHRYSGLIIVGVDVDEARVAVENYLPAGSWLYAKHDSRGAELHFDTPWLTAFNVEKFIEFLRTNVNTEIIRVFQYGETPGDVTWHDVNPDGYEIFHGEIVFYDEEYGNEYHLRDLVK